MLTSSIAAARSIQALVAVALVVRLDPLGIRIAIASAAILAIKLCTALVFQVVAIFATGA